MTLFTVMVIFMNALCVVINIGLIVGNWRLRRRWQRMIAELRVKTVMMDESLKNVRELAQRANFGMKR